MTKLPPEMSEYERKRWEELCAHWERKSHPRLRAPESARRALGRVGAGAKGAASLVGRRVGSAAPEPVKRAVEASAQSALRPTVEALVRALDLVNDWIVELTDPKPVLLHHRVENLADLRTMDLERLDAYTRRMVLRWRTLGGVEGAALGSLAFIPVPVVGSALAIGSDVVATQALSVAIATRVCHSYGFDVNDPETRSMVDRMVRRGYGEQAGKATTVHQASSAFVGSSGRLRWSAKLRQDHKLMAGVEQLLKQLSNGKAVPVQNARMGMPGIAVIAGLGTNSYLLGEVTKQARRYAATLLLAERYGLPLPTGFKATDDQTDAMGVSDSTSENIDGPSDPAQERDRS